jgi:hypothetical protein
MSDTAYYSQDRYEHTGRRMGRNYSISFLKPPCCYLLQELEVDDEIDAA